MSVTALSAEPLLRRLEAAQAPAVDTPARTRARDLFLRYGLPHRKVEAWKYTDLKPVSEMPFVAAVSAPVTAADLAPWRLADAHVLVFIDGGFRADLSEFNATDGVSLGRAAPGASVSGEAAADAVAALNGALATDGALVRVPDGVSLDRPVQFLFVATGGAVRSAQVRNRIDLGRGASASVVETYAGLGTEPCWTNVVTDAVVAPGAALDHAILQSQGSAAWHTGRISARVDTAARFSNCTVSLGAATARQDILVQLAGVGAECRLTGANLGRGQQHLDYFSRIDHAAREGRSVQDIRVAVDDRAMSIFQGCIAVAPDAQKTDAKQLCRNLLLGERSIAFAKPELEILADDVKCTHGATTGDLGVEELFYLRARGIGADEARQMLVAAFVADVLEGLEAPVRGHLESAVSQWLRGAP